MKNRKLMLIDPPLGWKFGFPKEYVEKEGETVEQWLVSNGYPQEYVDEGYANYCWILEYETGEKYILGSENT